MGDAQRLRETLREADRVHVQVDLRPRGVHVAARRPVDIVTHSTPNYAVGRGRTSTQRLVGDLHVGGGASVGVVAEKNEALGCAEKRRPGR